MKMFEFTFDSTCPSWAKNEECNRMFIKHLDNYLNIVLENRGYVYLNQIYESFGVGWDPKKKNPCFMKDECNSLTFIVNEVSPYVYNITIQAH